LCNKTTRRGAWFSAIGNVKKKGVWVLWLGCWLGAAVAYRKGAMWRRQVSK
jgi:hypothetical protein